VTVGIACGLIIQVGLRLFGFGSRRSESTRVAIFSSFSEANFTTSISGVKYGHTN
jgi:hypothetical protein